MYVAPNQSAKPTISEKIIIKCSISEIVALVDRKGANESEGQVQHGKPTFALNL